MQEQDKFEDFWFLELWWITLTCKVSSEQENLKSQSIFRKPFGVRDKSILEVFLNFSCI